MYLCIYLWICIYLTLITFYSFFKLLISVVNSSIKKTLWLRPYIEFSIRKRKEVKARGDKIDSTFCKLMNNAFYVKTIENVYK